MATNADLRRRWLGGISLGAALLMLIAGETVLRERLSGVTALLFWMACFALTFLAMLVAFLDMAVVRRRLRDEQRALLEDTFKDIAREKQARSGKEKPSAGRR